VDVELTCKQSHKRTCDATKVAGNFAGIDASGRVVELGWQVGVLPIIPFQNACAGGTQCAVHHSEVSHMSNMRLALGQVFPTLKQLAWEAQWLAFQAELHANLSRPALVVPMFKPQVGAPVRNTCTM
jgi:hypothetical protein